MRASRSLLPLMLLVASVSLPAQSTSGGKTHEAGMTHSPGMDHSGRVSQPTQGGQAAFATIAEIVKILEADSSTDWSKVNLESLRQHLIDMDNVTLRARVASTPVAGGLRMEVTGNSEVATSIRRMLEAHAPMLQSLGGWRADVAPMASGMRFLVVASNSSDRATEARIRGLGFIGLMTTGEHHAQHHLQIARGDGAHAHGGH